MPGQHLPISLWLRLCRWLWKYPLPFLFSTLIINVAINIGSTWLITSATTKAIPDTSIVGNIIGLVNSHWVLSLFFGMISIALLLVTWLGSRESESTPAMPRQVQMSVRDRERMLRRLHVRYEQLLAQSLQGAVQIELGLTSRPAAIHNAMSLSLRLPEQSEQALPAHTSILDAYNLAQQELLILGEPGAGKSTLLLELAQHLVDLAEQDAVQPLPVVLPLSSWATKRLSLQEWLIEQFALLYDVPHQLSYDWMQAGFILPLLDGLDEMEESARPACIAAVNTYHREHLQPLVVCSRTNEYDADALHERIALHSAVVVQPLTLEQIDAHLATIGKPLTALRTALKKNATLQTLATTPLLLQILMLTYHGIPVRTLSHKEDLLREQIWTDYVQCMVSRKGNEKRYPLNITCMWLSWLARGMREHNQMIFSLEWLQPDWLRKRQRSFYQWNIGLDAGLIGGLYIGPISGPIFGLVGGPIIRLAIGLVSGLFIGLFVGRQGKIEPVEALTWSWKKLRFVFVFVLFSGFFELISKVGNGKVVGLINGLSIGLIGGLAIMFQRKQLSERLVLSPNEGIQRSVKNGLVFWFIGGLIGGVLGYLGTGLVGRLTGGLIIGLVIGLVLGLGAVVQHYTLRFWLWCSHSFPLKAIPFLEDATARILLQRVGGGYRFTHRLLLDYFADLQTTTPAPSPGPHPTLSPPSS